ncbi:MAG TPA: hypothetical protein VFV97_15645 [Rhodanobacteraceae bacterium]|nr:hypothetical protein [Rhodanobacteraceae bacterium]
MIQRFLRSPILLDARLGGAADVPPQSSAAKPRPAEGPVVLRRLRVALLVVALCALWLGLLGWASQAPLNAAFQPVERVRFEGSDFHVVFGAAVENGKRLAIAAVGPDHMALQSATPAAPLDAASFPVLRYRWQDFPRTLELSFVFRRADEPDDVHTITLPPAGAYPAYFDLASTKEWHGRIIEAGFAEFPTAQLVPADIAFRPFALVEAELWSPSWRGSLGALGTDWSAYRPWALMSVSALGPDAPWPHKPTPVLVLTIGLAASLAIAAALLARSWTWLGLTLCMAIAGGWLALDLRWIGEFADRHVLTRQLYAGKPWRERATIEPDTALIAAASRVRDMLARVPPSTHVVVAASGAYDVLRLVYHLLPANVAPMTTLAGDARNLRAMQPALLVVYADPDWTFDASSRRLTFADAAYAADLLFEDAELRIFRLRGAAP